MRFARRLVWWSGFALILLGIGALIWSRTLVSPAPAPGTEWWQGTLQALGIGLSVAGLVDVLAIFGLNRIVGAEDQQNQQRRQHVNAGLRRILDGAYKSEAEQQTTVDQFVFENNVALTDLDPDLRTCPFVWISWNRMRWLKGPER